MNINLLKNPVFNKIHSLCVVAILLSACGGSGNNTNGSADLEETSSVETFSVSGNLVKGPVTGAICELYDLDDSGVKVSLLGTSATINGSMDFGEDITYQGNALIECVGGTYADEATGETLDAPANRAVVFIDSESDFTVTPLTEIATKLAEEEGNLNQAITTYNEEVAEIFGLEGVSITEVTPTDLATDAAENDEEGQYATVLALVSQLERTDESQDIEEIIESLAEDLADGSLSEESLSELEEASDDLADSAVAENLSSEVIEEIILDVEVNADSDGDGAINDEDAFPNDASETADSDGDGVGDNADVFPNDATENADSDGDQVGDNADAFPNNSSETTDSDEDGVGDNADVFPDDATENADADGDQVGDNTDAFPNDSSETVDSDGDGVGDNADVFPNDATENADADGDQVGDNADAFPNNSSETVDSDGDGVGDNADAFPNDASQSEEPVTDDGGNSDDGSADDDSSNGGSIIIIGNGNGATIDEFNPPYDPRTSGSYIVVSEARTLVFASNDAQQLAIGEQLSNPANMVESGFIVYTSSNSGIARVDINGLVTALRTGTAIITAQASIGIEKSYDITIIPATNLNVEMLIGSNDTEVTFSEASIGMTYYHSSDKNCDIANIQLCSEGAEETVNGIDIISTAATQTQDSFHILEQSTQIGEIDLGSTRWSGRGNAGLVSFKNRMWMIGGKSLSSNDPVADIWSSQDGKTWVEVLTDAPFGARRNLGVAVFNDKLWVIGGYDSGGSFEDVWSSEDGVNWTEVTKTAPFGERYGPALLVHDNKMWVVSGSSSDPSVWYTEDGESWTQSTGNTGFQKSTVHGFVFNDQMIVVLIKNTGTEIWTSTDGIIWEHQENADFPVVSWTSFSVHDDKVWATGGSFGGFIDTVWVSDNGLNYRRVNQVEYQGFRARYNAQTVSFNGHLWLMGGSTSIGSVNDVYSTTDGASWQSQNFASYLPARYLQSTLVLNERQYVIGGREQTRLNTVWSSEDGLNWHQETDDAGFTERGSHAGYVFNDKMWISGGDILGATLLTDIWSSTDGSEWIEETSNQDFGERTEHKIVEWNGQLWMTGGKTSSSSKGDVWSSSDGINWAQVTDNAAFGNRYGHGMVVFQNRLWVFGGIDSSNGANDVWSSIDGENWVQETVTSPFDSGFANISAVFNDQIVMVTNSEVIWKSSDGLSWSSITENSGLPEDIYGSTITVFNERLWIQGGTWSTFEGTYNSAVYTSEDGVNWRIAYKSDILLD